MRVVVELDSEVVVVDHEVVVVVVEVAVLVLVQRWEWAHSVYADRWRRKTSLKETRSTLRTGDDKERSICDSNVVMRAD